MIGICPLCKTYNEGIWVIFRISEEERTRVCKPCSEEHREFHTELSYYEKAKKKADALRKAKNAEVIRSYNLRPKKR